MSNLLQSIPSPMKIRDELERMVLADLLGPVGGEAEEIDDPSVRERYLVGMLAPKRQELSPEQFDELPQAGSGTADDGTTEYTAPTAKTMFPSSFRNGLLCGPGGEGIASYRPLGLLFPAAQRNAHDADRRTKTGLAAESRRQGVSKPITLQVGRITWTPDNDFPQVQVQGIVRKRDTFWSVTLFLVNGQEEPKKLRDTAWLFQPELIVQAPDGKPIFHSRLQQRDPGKAYHLGEHNRHTIAGVVIMTNGDR